MNKLLFGAILFAMLLFGMGGSENDNYYASDEEEWHLEIAEVFDYFLSDVPEIG